jgi:hypothetical protein
MRSHSIGCIVVDILAALLSIGVLYLYPAERRFTFTSGTTTAASLEAGGEIKVWLDEGEIDYGQNIVVKIADGLDADLFC